MKICINKLSKSTLNIINNVELYILSNNQLNSNYKEILNEYKNEMIINNINSTNFTNINKLEDNITDLLNEIKNKENEILKNINIYKNNKIN